MGTRALISIEGSPMLATHWDGYPSSLGMDLLNSDKSLRAVIEVARAHTIDAAHVLVLRELNGERVEALARKHDLLVADIRAGMRRGPVLCAYDYEISNIRHYGDWAEYEYDIRGEDVWFRPLEDFWPGALKTAPGFKKFTPNLAARGQEE